jgi:hypothetical protein
MRSSVSVGRPTVSTMRSAMERSSSTSNSTSVNFAGVTVTGTTRPA